MQAVTVGRTLINEEDLKEREKLGEGGSYLRH